MHFCVINTSVQWTGEAVSTPPPLEKEVGRGVNGGPF